MSKEENLKPKGKEVKITVEYAETRQKRQFEPIRISVTLEQPAIVFTGQDVDREIKKVFKKVRSNVGQLIEGELSDD